MAHKPANKLDHNAAALKRWRSRLKRAMRMVEKLERQRRRLELTATRPTPVTASVPVAAPAPVVAVPIDTGIPAFLQRRKLDPVAEQIAAEQAETKRKKSAGRIAKMKAKRTGELRKMPLTGKAALDAIRNG